MQSGTQQPPKKKMKTMHQSAFFFEEIAGRVAKIYVKYIPMKRTGRLLESINRHVTKNAQYSLLKNMMAGLLGELNNVEVDYPETVLKYLDTVYNRNLKVTAIEHVVTNLIAAHNCVELATSIFIANQSYFETHAVHMFESACKHGNRAFAQMVHSKCPLNIKHVANGSDSCAFVRACVSGCIPLLEWLTKTFEFACQRHRSCVRRTLFHSLAVCFEKQNLDSSIWLTTKFSDLKVLNAAIAMRTHKITPKTQTTRVFNAWLKYKVIFNFFEEYMKYGLCSQPVSFREIAQRAQLMHCSKKQTSPRWVAVNTHMGMLWIHADCVLWCTPHKQLEPLSLVELHKQYLVQTPLYHGLSGFSFPGRNQQGDDDDDDDNNNNERGDVVVVAPPHMPKRLAAVFKPKLIGSWYMTPLLRSLATISLSRVDMFRCDQKKRYHGTKYI